MPLAASLATAAATLLLLRRLLVGGRRDALALRRLLHGLHLRARLAASVPAASSCRVSAPPFRRAGCCPAASVRRSEPPAASPAASPPAPSPAPRPEPPAASPWRRATARSPARLAGAPRTADAACASCSPGVGARPAAVVAPSVISTVITSMPMLAIGRGSCQNIASSAPCNASDPARNAMLRPTPNFATYGAGRSSAATDGSGNAAAAA